jgi:hypothetical protein
MRPAAVPGSLTYPATRLGWLHQFCSLLDRAEVARQIGRDAMLLILAIAVQEDTLKYSSAPIFFDSELQRLTGILSLKHLDRIRQKAVDAGWLVIVRSPAGDQMVAQYWTLIPKRLSVFDVSANVDAVCETANVQHGVAACGNGTHAEQAVTHPASIVREDGDGAPGEPRPTADRGSSEVLSPRVGPPADAELEARAGSVGSPMGPSPSLALDNVGLNTPVVKPATPEVPGNVPVAAALAKSGGAPAITVVAKAAVVAQLTRQSIALPAEPKKLFDYPPHIRQQAGELLAAYPSLLDLEKGLSAICRVLEKMPYSQLRPLMNRYIAARNRPGQNPRLTPSAATWCDQERWKEDPHKWEVQDQDSMRKKA